MLGMKAVLQGGVIFLFLQALRQCCENVMKTEESLGHNVTHTPMEVEDAAGAHSLVLSRLKENLCGHKQGVDCELCPPEWLLHRGRCYYFSEEKRIWESSRDYCAARKSNLLVFENEDELGFISTQRDDANFRWIGLNFKEKEGWMWLHDPDIHGYSVTMSTGRHEVNCGAFKKGTIHADSCHSSYKWICKKKATLLDF